MISVVIRTLNESQRVGQVLSSLQSQKLAPDEVIIVNSGSTDGTIEIAKNYGAIVIAINKNEFTYGHALNVGFEYSKGNVIVSLSGHAIPANNEWLLNLVKTLVIRRWQPFQAG